MVPAVQDVAGTPTIGGGSDHMIRLDPLDATNPWDPWLGIWVGVTRETEGGGVARSRASA